MAEGIRQPKNIRFDAGGTVVGELRWSADFASKWNGRYEKAQRFVDSEVLRLNDRYVPFRQGNLKQSGILGTVIGSGTVSYIAPYSRYQYYGKLMIGPAPKILTDIPLKYHSGDPNRQAHWFERMKARHGEQIIRGAGKIAGGKA